MYDLEQVKLQMRYDPQIIRELEEYVADVALEYLEKGDFRKNKLFRKIEQVFLLFRKMNQLLKNMWRALHH